MRRTRADLQRLSDVATNYRKEHGSGVLAVSFDQVAWFRKEELGRLKLSPATHEHVMELIEQSESTEGSFVLKEAGRFKIILPNP